MTVPPVPSMDPSSWAAEEAEAERHIRAFISAQFLEHVRRLKGRTLGGWTIHSLHAVGAKGILWRASRSERHGLLKIPRLPYDRPAHFGKREVVDAQETLDLEAQILARFPDSLLPRVLEAGEDANPLLAGRSSAQKQHFLVLEFIPGRALDAEYREHLAAQLCVERESLMGGWMREILDFLDVLKAQTPPSFYTDFKPGNFRVTPEGRIRLLDGGSITWIDAPHGIPYTPGFVPAKQVEQARNLSTLEALSLTGLGRSLFTAVANKVLYEEVKLSLAPLDALCSPDWADWIKLMSAGRLPTIEEARKALPA